MAEFVAIDERAIVRVGDCSGAVIARDLVLTAAHCVSPGIRAIDIDGIQLAVHGCEVHPSFRYAAARHDLAVCRLGQATAVTPLALDLRNPAELGTDVTLFGFGATTPFGSRAASIRRVDTAITAVRDGIVVIGTAERTACTGDSGGPIVRRGEVVGVVHGTTGRFCASPADVVPIIANREWLASWRDVHSGTAVAPYATIIMLALPCVAFTLIALRRRSKQERAG